MVLVVKKSAEKLFMDTHQRAKKFKPSMLKGMARTQMGVELRESGVKVMDVYYDTKSGRLHCFLAAPSTKAERYIRKHKGCGITTFGPCGVIEVKKALC